MFAKDMYIHKLILIGSVKNTMFNLLNLAKLIIKTKKLTQKKGPQQKVGPNWQSKNLEGQNGFNSIYEQHLKAFPLIPPISTFSSFKNC